MRNFSSAKGLGLLFYEMLHIFFVCVIPTRHMRKKMEKKKHNCRSKQPPLRALPYSSKDSTNCKMLNNPTLLLGLTKLHGITYIISRKWKMLLKKMTQLGQARKSLEPLLKKWKSKYAHICLHESELSLLHVTHTPCKVNTMTDTKHYALLPNVGFPQEKKEQKDKLPVAYSDM